MVRGTTEHWGVSIEAKIKHRYAVQQVESEVSSIMRELAGRSLTGTYLYS